MDGRNSSDHNAHQNILELSGTEIVAFLVLCVFTNKHLDRHVPASSGVAGANVPSLENIILDMIWPGQGDMNWHLPLDEPAQLSVEDADPAFQFLCDSDLPDLGSLEGNTPSDDLHNVGMINQMADMSQRPGEAPKPLSIDQRPDYSTQLIGFSNESDPFSLEHFPYNNLDEVEFF